MRQRNVGLSGLRVSEIGLGCNNFGVRCDLAQSRAVIHKALDLGVTLFDTADNYGQRGGSEQMLGEILGAARQDIVIATKFSSPMDDAGRLRGASRGYLMTAVEASLKRLRTDWIDLYQLHHHDPLTPVEETLRALDDLVRQGKVRYIGASNLSAPQMAEAEHTARTRKLCRFVSVQNKYSLLQRGAETSEIPAMLACGVGLLPYFPLASGLLTGKYRRDTFPAGTRLATPRAHEAIFRSDADWDLIEKLEAYARERGRSILELAIGWLLARPVVASVIAGATTPEQIAGNVAAAAWRLMPCEMSEIDAISHEANV